MSELTPFQRLVESRRSIRKYRPDPVEREAIESCLEAARLAPSAENAQSWRFVVLDDPGLKNRFAAEVFTGIYKSARFAAEAPVLILVLMRFEFLPHGLGRQVQGIPFQFLDIGIAGEHLILRAEELGLGTCWIGWFNVRKARKFFKIPRRYKIASLISLGYPARRPIRDQVRKRLDQIAWFNSFKG